MPNINNNISFKKDPNGDDSPIGKNDNVSPQNKKTSFKTDPMEEAVPMGKNNEAASQDEKVSLKTDGKDKDVLKNVMEADPFANAESFKKTFSKPLNLNKAESSAPTDTAPIIAQKPPEKEPAPPKTPENKDPVNPFSKKLRPKTADLEKKEKKGIPVISGENMVTKALEEVDISSNENEAEALDENIKIEEDDIKIEVIDDDSTIVFDENDSIEIAEPDTNKEEQITPETAENKIKIEIKKEEKEVLPEKIEPKAEKPSAEKPKIVLGATETTLLEKKLSFSSQGKTAPSQGKRNKIKLPPKKSASNKKDNPPSRLSGQKILFGFLALGGLFVFLFYAIVFWGTVNGDASNPLFETLGVDADGLQALLLTMTTVIFGLLSTIFLIITLALFFRVIMAGKEALNRRQLFTSAGIYFILFLVSVGVWVFLYWFISSLNSGSLIKSGQTLIETTPVSVIDLDSPVRVEFAISEKMNEIISPENLRQINWDFDEDGLFDASGPRVSHRFLDKGVNNGIYKVKAYIRYFSEKKGEEDVYETERQVVINNESVSAVVTATPQSGTYPLEVELSGIESTDPDGSIVWYEWDLDGDGTFELRKEEPIVRKVFETVGEHKVFLRVTGTNTDDYDVMEQKITVKNPEGSLRAEITTDGVSEGFPPLKVKFDGSNSFVKEGKILRYEWLIDGSNEPFVGRKMEKVFRTPGDYEVKLIVQNDLGEKHEATKIIKILEEDAIANVVIDTTPAKLKDEEILRGIVPFEVTFNAENSDVKDAFEWQWDFENDGIVDEFQLATKHIFRKPGVYDVKLSIIDANEDVHEKIQKVVVERSGIRAKISASPNAGEVPLQISFDGSGSSTDEGTIVDYIWEFPNTEPIHYGSKISFLFKQIGNFPVKLTVLTSTGKISSTETIVSSRAPNVRSEFLYSPKIGSAPLNVTFNPISSKGLVREYLWDFGDGSVKKQYQATAVEHLYKQEGMYTVTLRLLDDNGIVSTVEQIVEVRPSKR